MYFVDVGDAQHSLVTDTCQLPHGEDQPAADLSYQLSGTNHTFQPSVNIARTATVRRSQIHPGLGGGQLEDLKRCRAPSQQLMTAFAGGNTITSPGSSTPTIMRCPISRSCRATPSASRLHRLARPPGVHDHGERTVKGHANLAACTSFNKSIFQSTIEGDLFERAGGTTCSSF
jgi:hypothetical protein